MTTDTDTLVALAALRDEITDEDLHESGRYFHDRSFGDLTRCSHGDTGNFSEDADGKAISLLWNFWRSGGLARIEALEREVVNLRQIERNIQAVREHEHKRAEAAIAKLTEARAGEDELRTAIQRASDAFSGIADHILERKGAPETIISPGIFADCQREGIALRTALASHDKRKEGRP